MLDCKNHPNRPAELQCHRCKTVVCKACARMLSDGRTGHCRTCGALLLPLLASDSLAPVPALEPPSAGKVDDDRPLYLRLLSTPRFLFRRSVAVTLLAIASFQWFCGLFPIIPILPLIAAGVIAGLFFQVVESAAYGVDTIETPDISNFWDAMGPLWRFIVTVLPLVVLLVWGGTSFLRALLIPVAWNYVAAVPWTAAIIIWLAFWPLLIIVGALTRSSRTILDPRAWVRTLSVMRGDYAIAALAFYTVLLVELVVVQPLLFILVRSPLPIVPSIAAAFVALAFQVLRARILGEACRPHMGV